MNLDLFVQITRALSIEKYGTCYISSNLFYQYSDTYDTVMPLRMSAPLKQLSEQGISHLIQ
jgi:hypothetical protein